GTPPAPPRRWRGPRRTRGAGSAVPAIQPDSRLHRCTNEVNPIGEFKPDQGRIDRGIAAHVAEGQRRALAELVDDDQLRQFTALEAEQRLAEIRLGPL